MRRHLLKAACLAAAPLGGFFAGAANGLGLSPNLYPFIAMIGVVTSSLAVIAFAAMEVTDARGRVSE